MSTSWTIISKWERGTETYYTCSGGDPAVTRTFHEDQVQILIVMGDTFVTDGEGKVHAPLTTARSGDPTQRDNLSDVVQVNPTLDGIIDVAEADLQLESLRRIIREFLKRKNGSGMV